MHEKKWFMIVASALIFVFAFWAAVNIAVDPFNAFGDKFFKWDSYTQTLNPRNSKAVYVSEHFDQYDSYIIGSSTAASFLPETLNQHLDANFYNMFHYGADTEYDVELVSYLLRNDDVKYIFLALGLNEANVSDLDKHQLVNKTHYEASNESRLSYYKDYLFANLSYAGEKIGSWKQDEEYAKSFDVFIPSTGVYDKRMRDVEPIGDIAAYNEKNESSFIAEGSDKTLDNIDKCIENVRKIKEMCDEHKTTLIVVVPPVSKAQLDSYTNDTVNEYFNKLSTVTEYWNFAVSEISYDQRYFYDSTHTRNSTADMVLSRIFGAEDAYYPDEFGTLCSLGNTIDVEALKQISQKIDIAEKTVNVPILLYHDLSKEAGDNPNIVSQKTFRHHMKLIQDNGYETVTFDDLIDFVEKGKPLPEKPVIVTFDDGYQSNYDYAFPVLEELNMKGTIFVIGVSVGKKDFYKDTEHRLNPHLGKEEIDVMKSSGLISIESHTYDMHQWAPFEESEQVREFVLPFENEEESEFIAAIKEDVEKQQKLFFELELSPGKVLAYPSGKRLQVSDAVFKDCGYKVTLTTDAERINTVLPGMPQSLIGLGRISVDETFTDKNLLDYLAMK